MSVILESLFVVINLYICLVYFNDEIDLLWCLCSGIF